MFSPSDLHLHSEYSYDAENKIENILAVAREKGFSRVGITDHLNFNDEKYISDLTRSAEAVNRIKDDPELTRGVKLTLGVELTPIALPEFEYIAKHKTREGYIPPRQDSPYGIELGMTKEELRALGVRYAVGASHWRVDAPKKDSEATLDELIGEWFRQQMWLAQDERVTILGHPWYNGAGRWYSDLSVIPRSMHNELIAALKENRKRAEFNSGTLLSPKGSDYFKRAYAELLREYFECGVAMTYGSDSHKNYSTLPEEAVNYMRLAGFRDGDITDLTEEELW